MRLLRSGKKGVSITNVIMPLVLLVMIAFIFFVSHKAQQDINSAMVNVDIIKNNADAVRNANKVNTTFEKLDLVIAVLTFTIIVGIAITSFKLSTERVFFAIVMLTSIIYGFIGYFLSVLAGRFVTNAVFSTVISLYPITVQVITNLHWVALAQIIIGSLALYAKQVRGQFLE